MKVIEGKGKHGLCCAYRCRNRTRKKDKFCPKHQKRRQKEADLVAYTYNALKSNARRRNKLFFLTLREFRIFCQTTGYLEGKGKNRSSLSIDRIDAKKAYCFCNIQILTLSENGTKGNYEKAPF